MPESLFFNKVAGLRPATLFKKRLWQRCFPMNVANVVNVFHFCAAASVFIFSKK